MAGEERGKESWTIAADPVQMLTAFEGWDARLVEVLAAAKSVTLWPLYDRPPFDSWCSNNIVLLGDACHPMLPYQAQGAAQAVEDAWVLAEELDSTATANVSDALMRYQLRRHPRATVVQRAARGNMVAYHLPDGPEQENRDSAMHGLSGNATLPYEWLWGSDPGAPPPVAGPI